MNNAVNAPPSVEVDYNPFADGTLARVVPTTEPQREIWLADRLGRDASLAFNESVSLRLRGPLDVAALRASLQALLDRHSALRAGFGPDGATLCVLEDVPLTLAVRDLTALDATARTSATEERVRAAVETPFALEHDRLFRAELVGLAHDEHLLILTAHHIVCDGWSWGVLVRELGALYGQHSGQHSGAAVAPLPAADDFAEYAFDQAALHDGESFAADEAYWLSQFHGEAPVLDLPTDRPRPARRSFASVREDYVLDSALVSAVRAMGARHGVSLFATLLASFAALLSRLSNQPQVAVGIPAAGQALDGHENLVGHCVNTLPLLFEVDLSKSIAAAMDAAQSTLLDALDHQRYTFGTLLRKLRIDRDPSRLPLISVMFNIDQALDGESSVFPGLELEFASNARSFENFELFINAVQERGALRLECQYNTALFDATTIKRWLGYWHTMLEAMVIDDAQVFGRLPLLGDAERHLVLEQWNDTHVDYPRDRCLHELIEAQVTKAPQTTAVTHEGAALSYAELNAKANRLARHLRELGVKPDQRVAICAERGVEMVVGLLAILKAGGAYVPLDPTYPADRLAYMLQDSKPSVLLAQQRLTGLLASLDPGIPVVMLDAPAPAWSNLSDANLAVAAGLTAEHLAYVIYTSGSTGLPKGAMNEHRGVVNRLLWMQDAYGLGADDAVLQKTPFSFDVSVWEFFWPLSVGAVLVMARAEGHKDPGYLIDVVQREHITTMHFVPSMLHVFLEHDGAIACAGLKRVICSGEALPAALVERFHERLPNVELHNLYGPTEAAVDVTAWACTPGAAATSIPIGRPIANTRIYLLDGFGQPVPMGVAGELFIGGVQVGRGYLNRPELTAERFLSDPFAREAGARMYKTGDLGRWRQDGSIDYLGRNDFQVKLRGFRIELGEIEKTLEALPAIAQAVVVARQDRPGDLRLVAYVVAQPGTGLDSAALSTQLKATLPEYMVPQQFVVLDAIPLSPNGKIDRKALPAPNLDGQRAAERIAPRTELERRVAAVMEQVLALPELGVDDNFFALGGHSLLAAQLTTRLNRELGVSLSLRAVFDAPTVARLAELLSSESTSQAAPPPPIERRADQRRAPLSLMQERLRMLEEFNPGQVSYNTPSGHRLTGPLDVALLDRALRDLAQRQTVLRTTIGLHDGEPVQVIHDDIDTGLLQVHDLSDLPASTRGAELDARLRALVDVPFADLGRAPLLCARLFKLDTDVHVLFFMPHHIIWDGWSFDLLYAQLSELYAAHVERRPPALAELPVTYGDYAVWHREWVHGPEYARQLAFWRERLAGQGGERLRRLQAMPTDKPRRPGMSGRGSSQMLAVPKDLTVALRDVGLRMDATLFVTLLTAYYALMSRVTGQRDLIVGTPVRGRNSAQVEDLMGYFTNLLPLYVQVDPAQSFADAVREVKAVLLDSFANPDIRLEDLVRELSLRSVGGGAMLYQSLFSFQDIRQRITRWGPLRHERVEVFQPAATEDLGMWFIEDAAGLTGGLIYNADIFHEETVALLSRRYLEVLHAIVRDPAQSIGALTRFSDGRPTLIGSTSDLPGITAASSEVNTMNPIGLQPAASAQAHAAASTIEDPRVRYLVELWSKLLGMQVSPGDNFFDLGGNSMLGVQMAERVARETGLRIKLVRLASQNLDEIAIDLPASLDLQRPAALGTRLARNVKRLFGRAADTQP